MDGKDKDDDHDGADDVQEDQDDDHDGADDVQEDQDDDGGHLVTALV